MTNTKLISPTNATPQFPANPPYDEGFAVLLEERDEEAWKTLLQEVSKKIQTLNSAIRSQPKLPT